jgi:hypothetical protein
MTNPAMLSNLAVAVGGLASVAVFCVAGLIVASRDAISARRS